MAKPRRKKYPEGLHEAQISKLSHDGRGICQIDGKTTFIDNALPGEIVKFRYSAAFGRYNEGIAEEIIVPSAERIQPKCKHFSICGGCSLQHMSATSQRQLKQQTLLEQFQHFGKTEIAEILPALTAEEWGYRRKARLSVRYVEKKQKVLVGFREKRSSFLADIDYCEVLHPDAAKLITPLKELILTLECYKDIPQIEVAVDQTHVALIFRHMQPLSAADEAKLIAFAKIQNIYLYLQPNKVESIHLLYPENASPFLHYEFPEHKITQSFLPSDFAQVNLELNRQMIQRALDLLALQATDRVLDLFCGFGNFTLPMARHASQVVGVEGSISSIERANSNAVNNHIENTDFYVANLDESFLHLPWAQSKYDKILLDPPRSGAEMCVQHIELFDAKKIVYISCNPATLARDTGILLQKGYTLVSAGIMDMFPHTNHVESIAVFEK